MNEGEYILGIALYEKQCHGFCHASK